MSIIRNRNYGNKPVSESIPKYGLQYGNKPVSESIPKYGLVQYGNKPVSESIPKYGLDMETNLFLNLSQNMD